MTRFGLVGSFRAQPRHGDALAEVLLEAAEALRTNPHCDLYLVSRSPEDADAVWVTEVWTDRDAHQASLQDDRVQELVARARPLIAGLGERFELMPVGGKGLPLAAGP